MSRHPMSAERGRPGGAHHDWHDLCPMRCAIKAASLHSAAVRAHCRSRHWRHLAQRRRPCTALRSGPTAAHVTGVTSPNDDGPAQRCGPGPLPSFGGSGPARRTPPIGAGGVSRGTGRVNARRRRPLDRARAARRRPACMLYYRARLRPSMPRAIDPLEACAPLAARSGTAGGAPGD